MRLAVVALVVAACGEVVREDTGRQAITGGSADTGDLAAIGLVTQTPLCGADATTAELFCSGVLIAPRVVLTAGHCTSLYPLAGSRLYAGTAVSAPGQWLSVASVRRHPSWTAENPRANDIALLVLEDPAPFAPVPVIATPLDGSFVGATVRVVGFGKDDAGAVGTKRHGTATVSSVGAATFDITAAPAMSCEGDSGGPVLVDVGGEPRVAGVTSFGDADCRVGTNTRVDAYASFIASVVGDVGTSRPAITAGLDTCAAGCGSDADCPRGMACLPQENAPNACALNGLPPGRFGAHCVAGSGGDTCADTGTAGCLRYQFCDAAPPDDGCAAGGGGAGWLTIGAIALVAVRRRRLVAIALLVLGGCGSHDPQGNCPAGTVSRGTAGTAQWCEERDQAGVRSGPFVEWYPNTNPARKKREGRYKHGKLDGAWVAYFPDGKPEREDTYVDGVLEGHSVEYHPGGGKKEEGAVLHGTRTGTWTMFYESGKRWKETSYADGSLTQRWTIYSEDGFKTHEGSFVNGRKAGPYTEYFPSGKPSLQGTWAESRKVGTWTMWDESGNVVSTQDYGTGEAAPATSE